MIYIFTALYCEAHALIRQFHLTKNPGNTRFQEFYNEESGIRLTITGVGEIAAAAAVSSICTAYPPTEDTLLLNIGTCAFARSSYTRQSQQQPGNFPYKEADGLYLCNQILEQVTGRSFYPDMLIRQDFQEAPLVTGMMPWDAGRDGEEPDNAAGGTLYDMEAAAVYQAGAYFFGPHQMMFLKVVSDFGTAGAVSKELVERIMEQCGNRLFDFIGRLRRMSESGRQKDAQAWEQEMGERLCKDMHCSKAMGDSLRQHLHYLALTGMDYVSVIEGLYQEGLLPCKDKREGKLRFEELKRRLF